MQHNVLRPRPVVNDRAAKQTNCTLRAADAVAKLFGANSNGLCDNINRTNVCFAPPDLCGSQSGDNVGMRACCVGLAMQCVLMRFKVIYNNSNNTTGRIAISVYKEIKQKRCALHAEMN